MKYLFVFLFVSLWVSHAQIEKINIEETDWQKKMNTDFRDISKSPLKAKDLKKFKSLDFYKYDSSYVVKAKLKRTPNSKWFNMKTTTSRLDRKRVFGILTFELNNKEHQLKIYQGKSLMTKKGYEDYLFLPFMDDTNGEGSYAGGRYIEGRIPESDTLLIDFNKAYNPYCAYSDRYSCPIVPKENYLPIRVEAGVKAFKK